MIKDNLNNAAKYYNLSERIEIALKYLQENDLRFLDDGKYSIDGEDIYMNVQEYETKISDKLESHRKYIDIQYMIKGQENMGVALINGLKVVEEYNKEKDIIFYNGACKKELVKENEFIIFYPKDAHLPCQIVDKPSIVKKVVVKIKI